MHGDADRVVPLGLGEHLHRQLQNSAFVVVPGGGHALPITHAAESVEMLAKEWRAVRG